MTNQEAFDKMLSHLRSLPARSADCDGTCVYNGSMCAVGALMTEEEQEIYGDFDGPVDQLLQFMTRAGHTSELHYLDEDMLYQMQLVHDSDHFWSAEDGFDDYGEEAAKEVADDHGFVYTAPENRSGS